jgi:hypothetical protein
VAPWNVDRVRFFTRPFGPPEPRLKPRPTPNAACAKSLKKMASEARSASLSYPTVPDVPDVPEFYFNGFMKVILNPSGSVTLNARKPQSSFGSPSSVPPRDVIAFA